VGQDGLARQEISKAGLISKAEWIGKAGVIDKPELINKRHK